MFKKLKALTIVSLLMMAGALWIASLKFDDLDVLKNGREVIVTIIDVPTPCGEGSRNNKSHFRFSYLEKVHRKNFRGMHCNDISIGGEFTLLTDTGNSTFVFKDEEAEIKSDIAAFAGLAAIFLVFAIIGQRQKEKSVMQRQPNYKKEKKPRQPKMGRYGNKIE
ncbi:hypothetical protein [uncultured Flavobacterium sp.]|uniref:hypothetical protein n=1 Tax=uncultured Flavobacterium sp. TaxID=165435 RepID=UPI0025E064B5|nr:hypothetical protein [uncultured Flavobacterium sp.]